jgi:hypothetical protein
MVKETCWRRWSTIRGVKSGQVLTNPTRHKSHDSSSDYLPMPTKVYELIYGAKAIFSIDNWRMKRTPLKDFGNQSYKATSLQWRTRSSTVAQQSRQHALRAGDFITSGEARRFPYGNSECFERTLGSSLLADCLIRVDYR